MGWSNTWAFRDCPWCGLRDAQMNVPASSLGAARVDRAPRFYTLVTCPRCGGASVIEHNAPDEGPALIRAFPDPGSEVSVRNLPSDVERFYRGAIRVLEAGEPDAAAVQLRRTLEAAAAQRGVNTGTLIQRIEKLIEKGLITTEFSAVLQHVRRLGNLGAHADDEPVEEEAARRALRFTTAVLRNLFEIPAELEAIDGPREALSAAQAAS